MVLYAVNRHPGRASCLFLLHCDDGVVPGQWVAVHLGVRRPHNVPGGFILEVINLREQEQGGWVSGTKTNTVTRHYCVHRIDTDIRSTTPPPPFLFLPCTVLPLRFVSVTALVRMLYVRISYTYRFSLTPPFFVSPEAECCSPLFSYQPVLFHTAALGSGKRLCDASGRARPAKVGGEPVWGA